MAEAAPLLAAAGSPAPEGGSAEWVVGEGGVRLRAALFPATTARARGSVVLSPGRTESIEKYYEAVEEFRARGFAVLVHDWRGQGLSQRLTDNALAGHASGWRPFVADFRRLLDAFEARLPKPWIALGHSMGGCLDALVLVSGETRFSAAILTAPMLGVDIGGRSPVLTGLIARAMTVLGFAARYVRAPREGGPPAFEDNPLTHDAERWGRTPALLSAHPDLALGDITWGWLDFALSAGRELAASPAAARVKIPVTIVAAGDERLVINAASQAFAARLPHSRYVEIEGARHEILMETDALRAPFWTEFDHLADTVAP